VSKVVRNDGVKGSYFIILLIYTESNMSTATLTQPTKKENKKEVIGLQSLALPDTPQYFQDIVGRKDIITVMLFSRAKNEKGIQGMIPVTFNTEFLSFDRLQVNYSIPKPYIKGIRRKTQAFTGSFVIQVKVKPSKFYQITDHNVVHSADAMMDFLEREYFTSLRANGGSKDLMKMKSSAVNILYKHMFSGHHKATQKFKKQPFKIN
jgi:hypothetical protein